jgi:hypothetical protein
VGKAAGVVALALAAAACGGDTDPAQGTGGDGKDSAAQGQGEPVRPVPVDDKQHEITWTDLQDQSHVLRAAPRELARGSAADFADVRLDEDLKGMVPYYLTVSYTNEGKKSLQQPPQRDFLLVAADGQPGKGVSVFSSALSKKSGLPKACSQQAPRSLKPGGTATVCQIVMMPKDRTPAVVSYTGKDAEGSDVAPVVWRAGDAEKGELPAGVLPFKKSAESAVQDAEGRTVQVEATPRSIRPGRLADLSRFKLGADEKNKVPYYVTVRYRNNGTHKLLPQMNQKTELRAVSGQPARRLNLIDFSGEGFPRCPDAKPDGLVKPKAAVTECAVFMLAKNDSPASLVFTGEGGSAKTVTWQAGSAGAE